MSQQDGESIKDRPEELQENLRDIKENPSDNTTPSSDAPFNPRESQQMDSGGNG